MQVTYAEIELWNINKFLNRETQFPLTAWSNKMPKLNLPDYLKGEDVTTETLVTFKSPHRETEISQGEGKEPKIVKEIDIQMPDGKVKVWTMNKTSMLRIAEVYGDNTDAWVNKTWTIFASEQNVAGQMKKVIYAKAAIKPA